MSTFESNTPAVFPVSSSICATVDCFKTGKQPLLILDRSQWLPDYSASKISVESNSGYKEGKILRYADVYVRIDK